MKRCLLLCLLLAFRISFAGETADLNNKHLVILGDSITKGGRYASYMDYYLLVQKCRATAAAVYIMTPPPFDPKNSKRPLVDKDAADFSFKRPYKDYDDVLADYAAWLIKSEDKSFIKKAQSLQKAIDELLAKDL